MSKDSVDASLAKRLDKLYEFERAPVTQDKLHSGRYFAGMFAGEHVAATEFVIGALFVNWGVGARDLILGLLIGNALAVLSWAFICSPIAVQTRLTLYWYVRRIIGPGLTVVYNFINAILYCCLAAAMIGVSASAVFVACNKAGLDLRHPSLKDIYPNSVGWVVVVGIVGAVVVVLAIAGFKKLSQFASVCAPWMFTIFVVGAIASLPGLGNVRSWDDLARIADEKIWTGKPYDQEVFAIVPEFGNPVSGAAVPETLKREFEIHDHPVGDSARISRIEGEGGWLVADGKTEYVLRDSEDSPGRTGVFKRLPKLSFWHIVFFAWFCNLAMHVGLSDMAVFRYAKHWTYGFYSAFGMYLGHYVAWVCAGVMGAVVAGQGLNPGEMADKAAGYAGILAVLIAGWTTANPTIYRAGLALQIVTPNWDRWKVTLVAGAVTTFVGCFPAIFMRLLDFVAIYGLTLMPIGAVIVTEHWIFPKLGLPRYWTERRRLPLNLPALIAWLAVLAICFPFEAFFRFSSPMQLLDVHLFFRWLPGWFIASAVYTILCLLMVGRKMTVEESAAPGAAGGKDHAPTGTGPQKTKRHLSPVAWIGGGLALLSLIGSVYLSLTVFLGGADADAYTGNLSAYKTGLLAATVIYFLGAIAYNAEREKTRKVGQGT